MIARYEEQGCGSNCCSLKANHSASSLTTSIDEHDPSECPTSLANKLRRDVSMTKMSGAPFGADFVVVGRRLLVCFVLQNQTGDMLTLSAAYRAGLRVGDEILSFNETDASGMEPWEVECALRDAHVVNMEIREASLTHTVNLHEEGEAAQVVSQQPLARFSHGARKSATHARHSHHRSSASAGSSCAPAGIVYSEGKIASVLPDSPAAKHHVPCGDSIVEINGHCTLGAPDHEITFHLREAMHAGGEFVIKTMRPAAANGVLEGLVVAISNHRVKCTPVQAIDSDFSAAALYSAPSKRMQHDHVDYVDTDTIPEDESTNNTHTHDHHHHHHHHHHHGLFHLFHSHHRHHHSKQNESSTTLESNVSATSSASSSSEGSTAASIVVRETVHSAVTTGCAIVNQSRAASTRTNPAFPWSSFLMA